MPVNVEQIKHRIVGSREPIGAQLLDATRTAVNLSGATIVFRLIKSDGTVTVNDGAATLDDAANGKVSYTPGSGELAAGTYAMYFVRTDTAQRKQWPPEGRVWQLEVHAENERPT